MRLFLVILMLLPLSVIAQSFTVDTLIWNGPASERINFVFLADGYLSSQLDDFVEDAEGVVNGLFGDSPFKEYKPYFNVVAIRVPSNEEGAYPSPSQPIDNYFGSTFGYAGIDRLLVPTKSGKIYSVLADNFPSYDQIFVIVNSTKYGGSGGVFATSSVHQAASEIAIHEIGHSFSNLADEYWAGSQYARERANMTANNDPNSVKWKSWLQINGTGIYEHSGAGAGWYKPHQMCKMQFLGKPFCPVCRETITETIWSLVSPLQSYAPLKDSIPVVEGTQLFELDLIHPQPSTLSVRWELDDKVVVRNRDSFHYRLNEWENGQHSLVASVLDTSGFSKKTDGQRLRLRRIEWLIQQDATVQIEEIKTSSLDLQLYPNPASSTLFLKLEGSDQPGHFAIYSIEGKKVLERDGSARSFDVSNLQQGQYFLVISWESGLNKIPFILK